MTEEFKMPEQAEQLTVMSAIADVVAEAFVLADSAKGSYEYPLRNIAKLRDAVAGLRATGWRPDAVITKRQKA